MKTINIVWLKRDLRLTDHEPLKMALEQPEPTLLIYLFEPMVLEDEHYSERHWRFVGQSIQDLNSQLAPFDTRVLVLCDDAVATFERLIQRLDISGVYSHEEVGIDITFTRDKQVAKLLKDANIPWIETPMGAVIRAAQNRLTWDDDWQSVMRAPNAVPSMASDRFMSTSEMEALNSFALPQQWLDKLKGFQTGGPTLAWRTLKDFFADRGRTYSKSISKPLASRTACSRLSPYLAWGNISLREVYQYVLSQWNKPGYRRSLIALTSRLHWHCHFIQKFESESSMEFEHLNRGYSDYPYSSDIQPKLNAWKKGETGVPMVDACMRCLHHTGYINFRMRAMLVSFLTHHLNIDWRHGVKHLASLFLDFEPGIHYAQFQMQAGVTGINTIRIYNPVKQSQEHDSDGHFIKLWLPELDEVPVPLLFEPWKLTPMEAELYRLDNNSRFLDPIIELEEAARAARDRLWGWKKKPQVQKDTFRILQKHVRQK